MIPGLKVLPSTVHTIKNISKDCTIGTTINTYCKLSN